MHMENLNHATHPTLSKIQTLERSDLLRVLNGTYIAKRFFGKSCSWFSQRINGHLVNGVPAEFTPEELGKLRDALDVLAIELQELADELR